MPKNTSFARMFHSAHLSGIPRISFLNPLSHAYKDRLLAHRQVGSLWSEQQLRHADTITQGSICTLW